ncbi:hypothetical protein ACFL1B_05930 [Nanoarchaeota archaeon]
MKGQVSVEYLMVVGIALMILVPGAVLFYNFSKGTSDQLASARINRAGVEILSTAEAMYAVGQNSWATVAIDFPETVKNIYILNDDELVVRYEGQSGMTDAVFFSDISIVAPYPGGNISSNFQPGLTKIKVASRGPDVEISELII